MQDSDRDGVRPGSFDGLPACELSYALDDEEDPTEITLFRDDGANVITSWITMDVEFAVDPYEVA